MKKILTILLISIILPITTHALNPKIVVGGTELTGSVLEVNGNTGKATYNPSTKTLTLDNYSYNGIGEITEYLDYSEFKSVISILDIEDVIILVKGTNTINLADENASLDMGIFASDGLTIKGENNSILNINVSNPYETNASAIYYSGLIKIENLNLNMNISTDNGGTNGICFTEINSKNHLIINNSKIYTKLNGKSSNYFIRTNSAQINDSTIEVETVDNGDENASFFGICATRTIINNSKIKMKSTYKKNSSGIDSCWNLVIKNSELYLDVYKGVNSVTAKNEYIIQSFKNTMGLDDLEILLKVDNSIIEINSKIEPITCIRADDKKDIVPTIVHENYNNYKILVGESKTDINDWDNESLLTNYRYLKIFDLVETNNEIKNKEDSNISIDNNLEEIIPLTEQEQKLLDYGYEIEARIDMEETTSVVEEVKNKILEKVDKKSKIASFINIDLVKVVNGEENTLTELDKNIKVEIKLDDKYINKDKNITRTYKMLRYHDDEVDVLNATFDKKTGLLKFETNKFSTYALIYADEVINPQTGDNLNRYILLALISSITLIATIITKRTIEI